MLTDFEKYEKDIWLPVIWTFTDLKRVKLKNTWNEYKEKKSMINRPVSEKIRILEIGIHSNKQTK